ncbi:MAG: R3H domain-containing nucleic acid-binding protein [Patescibacteria group bacterium]
MTSDDVAQLIREFLKIMSVTVEGIDVIKNDGREEFRVRTPDSHLLIGSRGAHLFALNHLLKRMAAKRGGEAEFSVDINGYQEAARANLLQTAKIMGERARSFKTSVELSPMSSYERMLVHSFFQGARDLATESVGEGERRRVVIKYTGEL